MDPPLLALYTYAMDLHIRSATQSDVKACVTILRAWDYETPWLEDLAPYDKMIEFWTGFLMAQDLACIAEIDGQVVGFCTRSDDNIGALYVASAVRNLGVGKRLLDTAKQGRDWITVWAYEKNVDALRFYKREGLFERSREVEEESGLVDIEHRWIRTT